MNTNLRILLVGKICGEDFAWTVSPLPVEEQLTDEEVNRLIDAEQCAPDDTHDLWWHGYHAQRAGGALASMPDEYSECGWWAAYWHYGKYEDDGAIECDYNDIRRGGSGMGLF